MKTYRFLAAAAQPDHLDRAVMPEILRHDASLVPL
eukprot:COSAG06_NODE_38561_length_422_cov_0.795666_1_plen_34_part_10